MLGIVPIKSALLVAPVPLPLAKYKLCVPNFFCVVEKDWSLNVRASLLAAPLWSFVEFVLLSSYIK